MQCYVKYGIIISDVILCITPLHQRNIHYFNRATAQGGIIMATTMVVFENNKERARMCADFCHDWNQKKIFGSETQKLLDTCEKLFRARLQFQGKDYEERLLKKIFGIAKAHGLYITWYGKGCGPCEPDRFLVSGRGFERLAFIQC